MLTIHGKSISGMVTIGPLRIFRHQPMDFARTEIENRRPKSHALTLRAMQQLSK